MRRNTRKKSRFNTRYTNQEYIQQKQIENTQNKAKEQTQFQQQHHKNQHIVQLINIDDKFIRKTKSILKIKEHLQQKNHKTLQCTNKQLKSVEILDLYNQCMSGKNSKEHIGESELNYGSKIQQMQLNNAKITDYIVSQQHNSSNQFQEIQKKINQSQIQKKLKKNRKLKRRSSIQNVIQLAQRLQAQIKKQQMQNQIQNKNKNGNKNVKSKSHQRQGSMSKSKSKSRRQKDWEKLRFTKKSVKISQISGENDDECKGSQYKIRTKLQIREHQRQKSKQKQRELRVMKNLLNSIQAHTYRQIQEKKVYSDGRQQTSYQVFKTTNKIDIDRTKDKSSKHLQTKKDMNTKTNIDNNVNTNTHIQTHRQTHTNININTNTNIKEAQSRENEDKTLQNKQQSFDRFANRSMRNSKAFRKSRFSQTHQQQNLQVLQKCFMINHNRPYTQARQRRSRLAKFSSIKPRNSAMSPRAPCYKWSNWRINPKYCQLHLTNTQSSQVPQQIRNKMTQSDNLLQMENHKKYKQLHFLTNLNNELMKIKKNNIIIDNLKEQNDKKIQEFFRNCQKQIKNIGQDIMKQYRVGLRV